MTLCIIEREKWLFHPRPTCRIVDDMVRYAIMFLACVFVSGSMAFILTWYLRKLRKIEEDKWGKNAAKHQQS